MHEETRPEERRRRHRQSADSDARSLTGGRRIFAPSPQTPHHRRCATARPSWHPRRAVLTLLSSVLFYSSWVGANSEYSPSPLRLSNILARTIWRSPVRTLLRHVPLFCSRAI